MSLGWNRRITDADYRKLYEYGLICISGLLLFRPAATVALFIFVILSLICFRRLKWTGKVWISIVLIASPLILDLLFLWNNDSLLAGVKNGEKHLPTLIFPFFILAQGFLIDLNRLLKGYTIVFTSILSFGLLRYMWLEPAKITGYLEGFEVWRMGYDFALSLDIHAPAMNMHIAFLVVTNFFLLLNSFSKGFVIKTFLSRFSLLILSGFFLLVVNTRMALLNVMIGFILLLSWELSKGIQRKRLIWLTVTLFVSFSLMGFVFVRAFPYVISKYTEVTFKHMDKVGRLDELENPEAEVYSALVTRVTIWNTTLDLCKDNLLYGVGAADARNLLIETYKETDQQFLYRHQLPIHNQYLDFLLKFGILGLIVVLIYVVKPIWLGFRSQLSLAVFFGLLIGMSNLTDDFLVRFDGIAFYAFWLSIFSNQYWKKPIDIES